MGLIDNDKSQPHLECFNCGNTNFTLRETQRLSKNVNNRSVSTNNWQVLLRCQNCIYSTTQQFNNFNFEYQLIDYLRRQKIIGNKKIKDDGYWIQDQWFYPWDDESKEYRLDKPRGYIKRGL